MMEAKKNFDSVASVYDQLARLVFGKAIDRAQDCLLDQIPPLATVLIFGGGSGRVAEQVLLTNPQAKITYIEASQKMLDLTKDRLKDFPHSQVDLILGSEQFLLKFHDQFDVVITQFILDVYERADLQKVMALIDQSLKQSGKWIFADFILSSRWYRRWWQWLLVKIMYLFFAITAGLQARSLLDFRANFNDLGWEVKECKLFYADMISACVFEGIRRP